MGLCGWLHKSFCLVWVSTIVQWSLSHIVYGTSYVDTIFCDAISGLLVTWQPQKHFSTAIILQSLSKAHLLISLINVYHLLNQPEYETFGWVNQAVNWVTRYTRKQQKYFFIMAQLHFNQLVWFRNALQRFHQCHYSYCTYHNHTIGLVHHDMYLWDRGGFQNSRILVWVRHWTRWK